jgi:hypothetical protein
LNEARSAAFKQSSAHHTLETVANEIEVDIELPEKFRKAEHRMFLGGNHRNYIIVFLAATDRQPTAFSRLHPETAVKTRMDKRMKLADFKIDILQPLMAPLTPEEFKVGPLSLLFLSLPNSQPGSLLECRLSCSVALVKYGPRLSQADTPVLLAPWQVLRIRSKYDTSDEKKELINLDDSLSHHGLDFYNQVFVEVGLPKCVSLCFFLFLRRRGADCGQGLLCVCVKMHLTSPVCSFSFTGGQAHDARRIPN